MIKSKYWSKRKEVEGKIFSAGKSKYPEKYTMFVLKIKTIAIPLKISRYTMRFAAFIDVG
jgi:hypothetical protein